MTEPAIPPAVRALLEGKNSEIKRHHLTARIGDYQGSRVQSVREVLDQWAPQEGTALYELWLQVKQATELYTAEIAAIQAESQGIVPGINDPAVSVHGARDLSPAAREGLDALIAVAKSQAACDFEHPHPEHPCGTRTPAPATQLRDQIAAAIHRYDNEHALSGNDIPSAHHRGEATAVLAVPAIQQLAETRDAHRIAEGDRDAAETEARELREELACVRMWLPVIRRALSSLPETCRYHGDQLAPHQPSYGREACCDTGIPARRRRLAMRAIDGLNPQEPS